MNFPKIDPVFLRVGPLEFRWYGLMYIIAFVATYFIVMRRATKRGLALTRDDIADLIFSLAVGVVLGGRLGYVIFYNLSYYLSQPLKILAVWEGGMSFHGGAIGAAIAGVMYARRRGVSIYRLADLVTPAVPVGLFFGRIGNFINGELFGRVTDVPWGVVFPEGGPLPRHPSQLYEAVLEGPVLLLALWLVERVCRREGVVFWTFVGGYGLFRFIVEFFREPDLHIGFILGVFSLGQLLSFPMFAFGTGMALYQASRQPR